MTNDPALDFATLLCSRLCHDLISPVGAIGNGVELMQAEGAAAEEDLALLADGAAAAAAALSFFRIAFGAAEAEARQLSTRELGTVAKAHYARTRLAIDWPERGDDLSRPAARLLLLTLMAAAAAAPIGGRARVAPPDSAPLTLEIAVQGRRAGLSPEAEALLKGEFAMPPSGRESPFALAARCAAALGARIAVSAGEETVTIRVTETRG